MEQNKQDSNKREAERAAIQAYTTIPLQDRRQQQEGNMLKNHKENNLHL